MKIRKVFLSTFLSIVLTIGLSVCAYCQKYQMTQVAPGTVLPTGSESCVIYNDTGNDVAYSMEGYDVLFIDSGDYSIKKGGWVGFNKYEDHVVITNQYYNPKSTSAVESNHIHSYKWQTIVAPTKEADGLEGELCSCGAMRNTQPLSAYAYALNEYATPMINAAKAGQTITFEFDEWNSFPKSFMEKLVEKNGQNVTFVFHYKWNHVKQEITIPAGTSVDTALDWYGPAKMAELYGVN